MSSTLRLRGDDCVALELKRAWHDGTRDSCSSRWSSWSVWHSGGILLWPAVAAPVVPAVLLGRAWRKG